MLKTIIITFVTTISILLFSQATDARTPITYPTPVKVEVFKSNQFPLTLTGIYELQNKQTNEKNLLQPGMTVTIERNNNMVSIIANQRTYTSSSGFSIHELNSKNVQVATFTGATPLRRGASDQYDIRNTLQNGEAALFNQTFVNSKGETWFNVTTSNGLSGWVSNKTTLLNVAPERPLFKVNNRKYRGSVELLPNNNQQIIVLNYLDIEDYLKGVVPNEMPSSWHMEALKAQAISARSYALNTKSLTDTPASQVYHGFNSESNRTNTAIEATRDLVVKYNGKPIQTFFFSTSGGKTANVGDVWNSNQNAYPYLVSVDDPFENSPHSQWSQKYNTRALLNSFDFGADVVLHDIKLSKAGANGEVTGVTLKTSSGDKTVSGNELTIRKLFPRDGTYGFLQSAWFDIDAKKTYTIQTNNQSTISQFSIKGQTVQTSNGSTSITSENIQIQMNNDVISRPTDPETIVLNGKGWGHRIGMSQYGAKGFAENGWTAEQILMHYYPGTTVSK